MFKPDEFDINETENVYELSDDDLRKCNSKKTDLPSISRYDYNLDSPIIIDKIVSFFDYLHGRKTIQLYNDVEFKKYEIWLKSEKVNVKDIISPKNLSTIYEKMIINDWKVTDDWKSILIQTLKDQDLTEEIFNSFKLYLFEKQSGVNKTTNLTGNINIMGTKFLFLHKLVILMNNCCCARGKRLGELFGFYFHNLKNHKIPRCEDHYYRGYHEILEKILITKDFIFFGKTNTIVSRDHILMFKDIILNRMNTFISNHIYEDYDLNDKLSKWLNAGDKCIINYGNDGYKIIKMIEPICNNIMSEIGNTLIEEFPSFPTFNEFINGEMTTLIREYPISEEFLRLTNSGSLKEVICKFGCYRFFGHPIINYLKGLEDLYELTHKIKNIDEKFIDKLASDMAYMVLEKKFREDKIWYIDELPKGHLLYEFRRDQIWPSAYIINTFGDNWHNLPLTKCFEIPEFIDPSELYSDKAHSLQLNELIDHIKNNNKKPIPTRRVLTTLLHTENINWIDFLKKINDEGFDVNDLIIGLRAKERELKEGGRFFALMSWVLRNYFVVTEYLIKLHFIPLFEGLTMADDMNMVITKMIGKTAGQDKESCKKIITVANHLDYMKWNSNQRGESNNKIFRVLGEFLGMPKLIERTHEVFENSFIYFVNRPDLMTVRDGKIVNSTSHKVCWQGQLGGLEGLRQKGWTISSMLMLNRLPKRRNTMIRTLAQGDNQIVLTTYRPRIWTTENDRKTIYEEIKLNNNEIMKEVSKGAVKMGLEIKKEECMQSIGFLNYGKVLIIKGVIYPIISKRIARISSISNDQVPTMANILSTVSSCILSISHFSVNIEPILKMYGFFFPLLRNIWEQYDCILGDTVSDIVPTKSDERREYMIKMMFLDPSLGGVCGMSLNRYLIRSFPDPVTEGLSFWKIVYEHTEDKMIRDLCISFGRPKLADYKHSHFRKLLENPSSLNLPGAMSPVLVLKEQILLEMIEERHNFKNKIVKQSIDFYCEQNENIIRWLSDLHPWYPKFISEFYSATFIGIVQSHIGMFQNARTIRNVMKGKIAEGFDKIMVNSEIDTIKQSISKTGYKGRDIWRCSTERADQLRREGWGRIIYGVTVVHPSEMYGLTGLGNISCDFCILGEEEFITTIVPKGFPKEMSNRGQYPSYLGSKTSESTSLVNPWEKESKIPLIRRAAHLRVAIGWFTDPQSYVASAIYENLLKLTGEEWKGNQSESFGRTGTSQHRYGCSRQSQGGYCAQNPVLSSHMITTTDTMGEIAKINCDFMYQASMLYCQFLTYERYKNCENHITVHHHIRCKGCIREIEEVEITAAREIVLPDVSDTIKSWLPPNCNFTEVKSLIEVSKIDVDDLKVEVLHVNAGKCVGFLYSQGKFERLKTYDESALFPLSLKGKINPIMFCRGIIIGVVYSCVLFLISRRMLNNKGSVKIMIESLGNYILKSLSTDKAFISLSLNGEIEFYLSTIPHKIPPSYPSNNNDLGLILESGLKLILTRYLDKIYLDKDIKRQSIIVYPEMNDAESISSYGIGREILNILCKNDPPRKTQMNKIREMKSLMLEIGKSDTCSNWLQEKYKITVISSEVRHALKLHPHKYEKPMESLNWGNEYKGEIDYIPLSGTTKEDHLVINQPPRIRNPLLSSIRTGMLATGSHYKIRTILKHFHLDVRDALCGGDGSGGICAMIMRTYTNSRTIFNSLMDIAGEDLRGCKPSPPSAIVSASKDPTRCVNLYTCWEKPSDLSKDETWSYFLHLKKNHNLSINLMTFDMQVTEEEIQDDIDANFIKYGLPILENTCLVIYKTYIHRLLKPNNFIDKIWPHFENVYLARTNLSSSHTSEIYILMKNIQTININSRVDWGDCQRWIQNSYCYKSCREELDRGRTLIGQDLDVGIPTQLLSDPAQDLVNCFQSLGITNRVSLIIGKTIKSNIKSSQINVCTSACNILIYNVNNPDNTLRYVPSNTDVENIGTLFCGFGLYISLMMNDFRLYQVVIWIINTYFWVWYDRGLLSLRSAKYQKTVKLNQRISPIQHICRSLLRMCNKYEDKQKKSKDFFYHLFRSDFNEEFIDNKIQFFNSVNNFVRPEYVITLDECKEEISELTYMD
ncbi:polymerase [Sena Madureira virus]|uniref:Replicase n=2 Tax=Rhabdoviridae TaxID=11270 RepID=A0A0D3R1A9_9RHAB|nr:polymerase [Sena Madureira virus]AJR28438.1 polymerase [Sena Madureira virus]